MYSFCKVKFAMVTTRLEFALVLILNILFILAPTSGLFDGTLTSMNMLFQNDTFFMNSNGLRIKKVNREHVMTGILELYVDVGNEYQMASYFFKKSGNEFKRMPYKMGPFPFCQYVNEDKYFIDDIRKKSDFPPIGTCPWPKMNYTIDGFTVKLNNIPPVFSSGNYMVETQFSKNGKILNGVQIFAILEHV